MQKLIIIILVLFLPYNELNPQQYFGDSYTEALIFCKNNKLNLITIFEKYDVNPKLAVSIVFPELIRYNRFRDFVETSALEIAYISGGKESADFSIGNFQMKPSFVEMLELEISKNNYTNVPLFSEIYKYPVISDVKQIRSERISRLKNKTWQIKYLACFYKLAEVKFKDKYRNDREKLLIFSSAYNLGLNSSIENIFKISKSKSFPYGNPKTGRFSYFDVAVYFYSKHSAKYFN